MTQVTESPRVDGSQNTPQAEFLRKMDDVMQRLRDVIIDAVKSATEEESPSPQAVSPAAAEVWPKSFKRRDAGKEGCLVTFKSPSESWSTCSCGFCVTREAVQDSCKFWHQVETPVVEQPTAAPTPAPEFTYAALGYLLPEPRLHYRLRSDGVVQYEALPGVWDVSSRTEKSLSECKDFVPVGALGPVKEFTYERLGARGELVYWLRNDGVLVCGYEFQASDYRIFSAQFRDVDALRAAPDFKPVATPAPDNPVIIIPQLPPNSKLLGTYHSRPYAVTQYGELVTTTAQGDWRKSMTFGTVGELLEHGEFVAAEVEREPKVGEIVGTLGDCTYRVGPDGKSLEFIYYSLGWNWTSTPLTLDTLRAHKRFIPAESAPRN